MILAILLGPYAGFLTMASVLVVQSLFFADGGLMALGCNIFNLGFFPCFIAYPFIFKNIVGTTLNEKRLFAAAIISAIVGLQLGSFSVVLQTLFSGVTELPFDTFVLLMQPIHLAIGIVEGLATSAVVLFVWKARPEIINAVNRSASVGKSSMQTVFIGFLAAAVVTGGVLSWFASSNPDGLEWSISKTAGTDELETSHKGLHTDLNNAQEKIALLPDYGFKSKNTELSAEAPISEPVVDAGKTVSGPGPIRVVASHEEITALKLTEEALRKSQEELIEQKQSLEETNIAMKVLLKQREEDKLDLEKKVLNNVKDLVLPYVEKLKNPRLKPRDRTLVDIISPRQRR